MPRMPRETWKKYERRMSKTFLANRIPVSGSGRHERDGESVCGRFFYQFKLRAVIPSFLFEWLDGIRGNAKKLAGERGVGVLVMNRPGRQYLDADSFVVLRACDWTRVLLELQDYDRLRAGGRAVDALGWIETPLGAPAPSLAVGKWYRLEDKSRNVAIFVRRPDLNS